MSAPRRPRLVGAGALVAVALRPRLWWSAAVFVARCSPTGWWRHWPPLPDPSPAYTDFRLHTALGREARPLDAAEVVAFLEWCRRMQRISG